MQQLSDFIQSERVRFEVKYNNMFAFCFSEIQHYHDYLKIILARYEQASADFIEQSKKMMMPSPDQAGEELWKLHIESVELTTRLHLEIESFYLFAKILLDKIAQAVEFYFGTARKMSLQSHDKFTKLFKNYAEIKGLKLDNRMVTVIEKLKDDISDFRDYQISHIHSNRRGRLSRGTIFDREGNTRLSVNVIYPKEKEKQHDSQLPKEAMKDIDNYIKAILFFINTNKDKTELKLVEIR